MEVLKLEKNTWLEYWSEDAHKLCFGTEKPKTFDRIDYALLVIDQEKPMGYITVRELDHESVYWQFGGAFPGTKQTVFTVRGYDLFLEFQSKVSKRVTTKIENKNYPMLKLALSRRFMIVGCGHWNGTTLVDLVKEF